MTDSFVDKLWGELDRSSCCPNCGSVQVYNDGAISGGWYCGHCPWRGDNPDSLATLTKPDLSALVERVWGEAVRDKILNDNFIEQLP